MDDALFCWISAYVRADICPPPPICSGNVTKYLDERFEYTDYRIQNSAKMMCDIGAMWTMRPRSGPTSCRPCLCSASRPTAVAHSNRTMATKGCIPFSGNQRDAKQVGRASRHGYLRLFGEARHQQQIAPLRCQISDSSVLVRM